MTQEDNTQELSFANFVEKDELKKVVVDSEELVKKYGGKLVFWTKKHLSMDEYWQITKSLSEGESRGGTADELVKQKLLKEDGSKMLSDGEGLPLELRFAALGKLVEDLKN